VSPLFAPPARRAVRRYVRGRTLTLTTALQILTWEDEFDIPPGVLSPSSPTQPTSPVSLLTLAYTNSALPMVEEGALSAPDVARTGSSSESSSSSSSSI
jgi:hypothetical protein